MGINVQKAVAAGPLSLGGRGPAVQRHDERGAQARTSAGYRESAAVQLRPTPGVPRLASPMKRP